MKKKLGAYKMFPPLIDAYHETYGQDECSTSLREFKKLLIDHSSEWEGEAIGRLFMAKRISEVKDLELEPIYVGSFNYRDGSKEQYYGVFFKNIPEDFKGDYYNLKREVRKISSSQYWDVDVT